METGFREHLLGGILGAIFIAAYVSEMQGFSLPTTAALSAIFLFSSLLPDIDSKKSKPRRVLRLAVFLFGALIAVLFYSSFTAISPLLALFVPFLLIAAAELTIPPHRGFLHSWSAAFLWGILAFAFFVILNISIGDSLLAGAFAAFGYLLHLLIDFFGDRF